MIKVEGQQVIRVSGDYLNHWPWLKWKTCVRLLKRVRFFITVHYTCACEHHGPATHRWSLSLMKGCLRVLKWTRVCESLWVSKSGTSGWNGMLTFLIMESHSPATPIRFRSSHFCANKNIHGLITQPSVTIHVPAVWHTTHYYLNGSVMCTQIKVLYCIV